MFECMSNSRENPMSEPTDYDSIAARYVSEIDERPWNAFYERPATLALLPDVGGLDVLDAGCGHGWYADWLWQRGARIIGVDRSARMAQLARERLAGRVRILQGDVTNLHAFGNETFDLVLSTLVVHYIADLSTAFGEWSRILRPRGTLVFSTHHPVHQKSIPDPGYLRAELIEEEWG
jgi:SAM-dependent methyltransferase